VGTGFIASFFSPSYLPASVHRVPMRGSAANDDLTARQRPAHLKAHSEPAFEASVSGALFSKGEMAMLPSTIWAPRILSVLRIVVGLILLQYGSAKLFGWPAVGIFENLKWSSLFGIAGFFELAGGTLLILGLFTRPAAFVLSGEMASAFFIEHFPRSFFPVQSDGDLAVALCFTFLYLAFAGGGPWSLDAMFAAGKLDTVAQTGH
jgi:putative oxidoreductase